MSAKMTDRQLRALKGPCERAVGGCPGLIVRVLKSGVRTFTLRTREEGKRQRSHVLGRYPEHMSLAEAREAGWALRNKLLAGEDPRKPVVSDDLAELVRGWLEAAQHDRAPKTIETYGLATSKFIAWLDSVELRRAADLTRAHLAEFRTYLATAPKVVSKKGLGRGGKAKAGTRRSPVSVNRELRTMKTVLNALRKQGRLPQLDSDAIADNLHALRVEHNEPAYLRPNEIRKLIEACRRHDAETFVETRREHAGFGLVGSTPRYEPILPAVLFLLLTGMRRGEGLAVEWSHVDLEAVDREGAQAGEIRLSGAMTKTGRSRCVYLEVSPALRRLLAEWKLRSGGAGRVLGGHTVNSLKSARARLLKEYGAPEFDWQTLRSTCATYLTNAEGIFKAATVFMSARQLGHSVKIAEKHYLGVERSIPAGASTLEAAMRIDGLLREVAGVAVPGVAAGG